MNEKVNLEINKSDIVASISKATAGTIPFIGPAIAEIFGFVIPNQRLDRLSKFVKLLNSKVENLENKLTNENSIDLLEDSFIQASRALTQVRLEYIASMLKNSLTTEKQNHVEKKKLLSILNELNDIEIIFLKYYSLNLGISEDHPFTKKHIDILKPPSLQLNTRDEEKRRGAFYENYHTNLERIGLIKSESGKITLPGVRKITELGKLFLEYIDFNQAEK